MHPAEEKFRLELVREGLKRFAQAIPLTLREVFGEGVDPRYRNMERKVVAGLVEQGVVEKQTAPTGQPSRYVLKNAQELVRIVTNDIELADLIWPGSKEPDVPPEMPEETAPSPVAEQVEQITEAPEEPPPAHPMSNDDKMERMIVLFTAAMQSIIYMRDKIDAMEKKVDRLYADLTGERP